MNANAVHEAPPARRPARGRPPAAPIPRASDAGIADLDVMVRPAAHRVRLIVLGSVDRGDDALGPMAVAELPPGVWPYVEVRPRPSLDIVDLVDVPDGDACLIVDAARGLPPGAVRFIPFERFLEPRTDDLPDPRSSHELPVPELIRLVAALRGAPPRGGILVAGGSSFGLGELPSREVALAIPSLVAAIEAAVSAFTSRRHRARRRA
jgi:hydrogenase maturation protease